MDYLNVCCLHSSFFKWNTTEIPKLQDNDHGILFAKFPGKSIHLFWHKIIIALKHIKYEICNLRKFIINI